MESSCNQSWKDERLICLLREENMKESVEGKFQFHLEKINKFAHQTCKFVRHTFVRVCHLVLFHDWSYRRLIAGPKLLGLGDRNILNAQNPIFHNLVIFYYYQYSTRVWWARREDEDEKCKSERWVFTRVSKSW